MSRHFKTVDGIKFRKNWACKDCGTSVKPIRFHKVTETGVILASQYNGAPPSGGNPTVLRAA